jgi:hypothetical protein
MRIGVTIRQQNYSGFFVKQVGVGAHRGHSSIKLAGVPVEMKKIPTGRKASHLGVQPPKKLISIVLEDGVVLKNQDRLLAGVGDVLPQRPVGQRTADLAWMDDVVAVRAVA